MGGEQKQMGVAKEIFLLEFLVFFSLLLLLMIWGATTADDCFWGGVSFRSYCWFWGATTTEECLTQISFFSILWQGIPRTIWVDGATNKTIVTLPVDEVKELRHSTVYKKAIRLAPGTVQIVKGAVGDQVN